MGISTKSEQAEQYLRNAIQSGRWHPGDALPSERELLVELGISRATLRNAMYSLAKDGLVVRKHGSGTHVAEQSPSSEVGYIVILERATKLSSPVSDTHRLILDEAQRRFGEYGYRTVLHVGHGGTADEFASSIHLFDEPIMKNVAGVLSFTDIGPLAERFRQAGITPVSLRTVIPDGKYCVVFDYIRMTQLAVDALRSHGYEDFAVMYTDYASDPLYGLSQQLYELQKHLANSAVGFRADRAIPVSYTSDLYQAYDAFKEWWAKPDRPRAIFFYDHALFEVASRAIVELGISVPDELAILTQANVGKRFQFPVKVHQVGFDIIGAASIACDMLVALVTGQEIRTPIVYMSPEIQEGESL